MGRYQARTIPHCPATFYPGAGHRSTRVDHLDAMPAALTA
jgi:hypothetical protein